MLSSATAAGRPAGHAPRGARIQDARAICSPAARRCKHSSVPFVSHGLYSSSAHTYTISPSPHPSRSAVPDNGSHRRARVGPPGPPGFAYGCTQAAARVLGAAGERARGERRRVAAAALGAAAPPTLWWPADSSICQADRQVGECCLYCRAVCCPDGQPSTTGLHVSIQALRPHSWRCHRQWGHCHLQ